MELLQDYSSGSGSSTTSFQSPGSNLPVPPTRQETMGWKALEWYAIYGGLYREAEQKQNERLDAYMPEGVKELNAVAEASAECLKALNLAIDQTQDALALDQKETLARCTIELIEAVKKEKEARDLVESAERKRKGCFDAVDGWEMSIASHMNQRSIAVNVLKTIDSLGIFAEEVQPMMLEFVRRVLNERRFPNIRTVAFVPLRSKDEEKIVAADVAQVLLENLAIQLDLAFVVRSPGSPPSSPGLTLSSLSPLPSSGDDDL